MSAPARAVLLRLLRRAESAQRRGADAHVCLRMAGCAEYAALASLQELEAFHAAIALAERAGGIEVQREARAGDGQKLLRLRVRDHSLLAKHLGVALLDDRVAAAEAALAPWRVAFPVLDGVLDAWRQNRTLRGAGPEAAADLADAARAVAALAEGAGVDRLLRRESVRLFGDSKRLEQLTPWLEVLVNAELASSGLPREAVWAALGLHREPQALLIAGPGCARVQDGELPLLRPYLGLPTAAVQAILGPAACLLSIENLASFHDATTAPGAENVLLLYTGGMPSPAWRAAYARILAGLPAALPVWHWGDIDEGGYRIAAVLARSCTDAGRRLRAWRMSPTELPASLIRTAAAPAPAKLAAMCRWAERAGWAKLADDLRAQPILLEQEAIVPELTALVSSCQVGIGST